jgi:uroporphyrinogen III methyltransferase / synthase
VRTDPDARTGMVYLVGAGPGDPGLLTVRALELLRAADVVAHDALVSPAILSLVGPQVELVRPRIECIRRCCRAPRQVAPSSG